MLNTHVLLQGERPAHTMKVENRALVLNLGTVQSSPPSALFDLLYKRITLITTRDSLTFVNTTAIAYGQKFGGSLKNLVYSIVVVFTNVRELRVCRSCGKVCIENIRCGGNDRR